MTAAQGKDSSEDSDTDSESEFNAITPDEKMKILNIGIRDLRLGQAFSSLADLKPRQLAYVLAGVYPWALPTDLLEIGGELASWSALCHAQIVCRLSCVLSNVLINLSVVKFEGLLNLSVRELSGMA